MHVHVYACADHVNVPVVEVCMCILSYVYFKYTSLNCYICGVLYMYIVSICACINIYSPRKLACCRGTYVHTFICTCICRVDSSVMDTCACMSTCTCICMCMCVCACVYMYMCVYVRVYYTHAYVYALGTYIYA